MKKHLINPAKPYEIVKEIFCDNAYIVDAFSKHFSKEILEFAELFSGSYKKYLELWRLSGDSNLQRAYVSGLTLLMLNNLMNSVKLFILGYQTPSGNLMRQAIEGVALATLCSLKEKIQIKKKKNKTKEIHFYTSFIEDKAEAKSHRALQHLEHNCQELGIQEESIATFRKSRDHFHKHSHPGKAGMATMMSFDKPGESFIGGSFDNGKMEIYRIELEERNDFCRILPNIIEWLIRRVIDLPNLPLKETSNKNTEQGASL